ncbi:MAG: deoxynucleoside kinase [Candidatus Pacearchaeota archaeon]|jgi:thymidylate kinase
MNNLIFLSGPHGSGKTTLADLIQRENPEVIVPELVMRIRKFYSEVPENEIDDFHRQTLKNCQRAIENHEYLCIARENPNKIILANRCIYDVETYSKAFEKLGWVNETQRKILVENSRYLYGSLQSPNAILLNPGVDTCKMHLENRWKTKKKKFKETDIKYLSAVCNEFESYRENSNVYYIDREINLEDKEQVNNIYSWIRNKNEGK